MLREHKTRPVKLQAYKSIKLGSINHCIWILSFLIQMKATTGTLKRQQEDTAQKTISDYRHIDTDTDGCFLLVCLSLLALDCYWNVFRLHRKLGKVCCVSQHSLNITEDISRNEVEKKTQRELDRTRKGINWTAGLISAPLCREKHCQSPSKRPWDGSHTLFWDNCQRTPELQTQLHSYIVYCVAFCTENDCSRDISYFLVMCENISSLCNPQTSLSIKTSISLILMLGLNFRRSSWSCLQTNIE